MESWEFREVVPQTIKISRPFCKEKTDSSFKERDDKGIARGQLEGYRNGFRVCPCTNLHVLKFIQQKGVSINVFQ